MNSERKLLGLHAVSFMVASAPVEAEILNSRINGCKTPLTVVNAQVVTAVIGRKPGPFFSFPLLTPVLYLSPNDLGLNADFGPHICFC